MNAQRTLSVLVRTTSLFVTICVAATAQDEPGTAPRPNLLPASSFEAPAAEVTQTWRARSWNGHDAAGWTICSPGRTSERCARITSKDGADAAWTTTVKVQPNARYQLSGWIKTRGVRGALGALLNIQNMPEVKTNAVNGDTDWTRVSTVFYATTSQLEINCLFGGWGRSTGEAYYDDVSLTRADDPPASNHASIAIDADAPTKPYSRMIFGGFLEHFGRQVYGGVFEPGSPLADDDGFRLDVIAALKELRCPIVRWPGGCYVSGYRWESGVGRARATTDDMAWGVIEPNSFGTDEFVALCRRVGWQPYVCNNAGNGTIQEMRNWVEYCNGTSGQYAALRAANGHDEPLGVRIWSIGNENWGSHEIGYKPIETWAPFVLEAAKAMKAVDPTIQLSAAALPSREWSLPLLKEAGAYLDFVSIHSYWLPLWQVQETPDYLTCIGYSEQPEQQIADFVDVLEESGYRGKIKIAFDEWCLRGWHHPGFPRKSVQDYEDPEVRALIQARDKNDIASQYTMADALFSASFLNACLRHSDDVAMANIAPIVNTRGPLFVHPDGVVRRTHFHALAMYANYLQPRVAQLTRTAPELRAGVPVIDAVATVDATGQRWAVALVNRHPAAPVPCTLRLGDAPLAGTYDAQLLTADSPDAYNDIKAPDRVTPKSARVAFEDGTTMLPPHSLTIVEISR